MWLKFKNVATAVIETFHLLLLTLLLGQTFHVQQQFAAIAVMASSSTAATTTAPPPPTTAAAAATTFTKITSASAATLTTATFRPPAALLTTTSAKAKTATTTAAALTHIPLAKGSKTETGSAVTATSSTSSASSSSPALALRLLTPTSSTSAATSSSLSSSSSLSASATNASKLLNFSLPTPVVIAGITDYNVIDTLSDDDTETDSVDTDNNNNSHDQHSDSYEEQRDIFLSKDYVMTKHIALSDDDSTRRGVSSPAVMTTSSISLKRGATQPHKGAQVSLVTPPSMSTATHRNPLAEAAAAAAASASASWPTASLVKARAQRNVTHSHELSTLSLLSLNDSASSELQQSTNLDSSISGKMSNQAPATSLRIKGNERNMHNTNSHLTVDHGNATIVATRTTSDNGEHAKSPTAAESSQSMSTHQHQYQHQHQHHHHHNVNTNTNTNTNSTAAGRNKSHSNTNNTNASDATNSNGNRNETLAAAGGQVKVNGTGTTRISARRVEHKYILPKSQKTDAPMLNYIFDTFSSANKHHHHDQRYGPHFEDVQLVGKPTNMTVQAGSSIHLNCRISLLQDKTVSWVRRNSEGEDALDLLTVGLHAYTGDKRYKMEFQYPNNWRLKISNVKKDDEATYECQISTHPPRVIQINLHVNAPKVMIVDEFGDPLQEKYYEQDSTLQLSCVVRNVAMSSSVVFWKHSEDVLNYDVTRGGISVKTELMDDGANSTLFIAKINKADSGNYTCSISEYQNYTIVVHILNGESFAELHHGNAICWHRQYQQTWTIHLIVVATILLILPAYVNR